MSDSDSDASPPRRRHDSSSSSDEEYGDDDGDKKSLRKGGILGRKEGGASVSPSPPRGDRGSQSSRSRNSLESAGVTREDKDEDRKRKLSDSDASPPRRKQQKNNSNESDSSDSDASPPRKRHDSSDSDASPPRQQKPDKIESDFMSKFVEQGQGKSSSSINSKSETTYRNKEGQIVTNVLEDYIKKQAVKASAAAKIEELQKQLRVGEVQKKEKEDNINEMVAISSQPFARSDIDSRLDEQLKTAIREGDPMAKYANNRGDRVIVGAVGDGKLVSSSSSNYNSSINSSSSGAVLAMPVYRGPAGLPNRFGIKPGYRWDGVNRGNGYEAKVLALATKNKAFKDDEYRWATSDL